MGCSLAKARFAQKGRANFLDGHPDAEPWGGGQRWAVVLLRQWGLLAKTLNKA